MSGDYLLFCKGADSSIFPRVVSGKVEQVRARVEQNAVVSAAWLNQSKVSKVVIFFAAKNIKKTYINNKKNIYSNLF